MRELRVPTVRVEATAQTEEETMIAPDPKVKALQRRVDEALRAYRKVDVPAWKTFQQATKPAEDAYERATRAALRTYHDAVNESWAAYERAIKARDEAEHR
jgi:hypothetical protein